MTSEVGCNADEQSPQVLEERGGERLWRNVCVTGAGLTTGLEEYRAEGDQNLVCFGPSGASWQCGDDFVSCT